MQYLTILGCGSSWGVPAIGCRCRVCLSESEYNKRTRSAIVINNDRVNILIDFGCDIRSQLLRENISNIDAAILTHDHADHSHGINDLKMFKIMHGKSPKLYSDRYTIERMKSHYDYFFDECSMEPEIVEFDSRIDIGDISVQLFRQHHGDIDSIGVRVKNTIYSNDVITYPPESEQYLYNAQIWIADCISYKSTEKHIGLDNAILLSEKYAPQRMYLTNLSHDIDYFELKKMLPDNIIPAHDGLKFEIL